MSHTVTTYDRSGHRHSVTTDNRDRAYRLFDEGRNAVDADGDAARVELRTDGVLHAQHGAMPEPEPEPEPAPKPEPTPEPAPEPAGEDTVIAHAPAPKAAKKK